MLAGREAELTARATCALGRDGRLLSLVTVGMGGDSGTLLSLIFCRTVSSLKAGIE